MGDSGIAVRVALHPSAAPYRSPYRTVEWLVMVPDEISIFTAQLCGAPFQSHHAAVHGARIGDKD